MSCPASLRPPKEGPLARYDAQTQVREPSLGLLLFRDDEIFQPELLAGWHVRHGFARG